MAADAAWRSLPGVTQVPTRRGRLYVCDRQTAWDTRNLHTLGVNMVVNLSKQKTPGLRMSNNNPRSQS